MMGKITLHKKSRLTWKAIPCPKVIDMIDTLNYLPLMCYNNVESLYLAWKNLSKLPKKVTKLKKLQKLDVSNNHIIALPKEIGQLKELKKLIADRNDLKTIPKEIGKLTHLTELNLKSNELETLPKKIGNLVQLIDLNVSENKLTAFPEEIGHLPNLGVLYFTPYFIKHLPQSICDKIKSHKILVNDPQWEKLC